MDVNGQSVLRLVTDDREQTDRILTSLGTEHTWSEVLAVEMDHKMGSLARILERLAASHLNVDYAYVSSSSSSNSVRSLGIFHTSNAKKALQVLQDGAALTDSSTQGRRPLHAR
jgi:hypothetical protein